MRRANVDSGFFICWILNMFFNWEIGAVAMVLWTISEWFHVSWYPAAAVAGIWIIGTFLVTALLCFMSGGSCNKSSNDLPNVNPYSKTLKDVLKDKPLQEKE